MLYIFEVSTANYEYVLKKLVGKIYSFRFSKIYENLADVLLILLCTVLSCFFSFVKA